MILDIVKYGHPVLRETGRKIARITPELRALAQDMIETMYAANGVGLAAQQIGQPLLLTVIDVAESDLPWSVDRPDGSALPMPVTLVNPVIHQPRGEQTGPEGCLSIPDVSADIRRADTVRVTALDLAGQPLEFTATGLLARAVQHEIDHLHGILFVDRMDAATRVGFAGKLKKLRNETLAQLGKPSRRRAALAG